MREFTGLRQYIVHRQGWYSTTGEATMSFGIRKASADNSHGQVIKFEVGQVIIFGAPCGGSYKNKGQHPTIEALGTMIAWIFSHGYQEFSFSLYC